MTNYFIHFINGPFQGKMGRIEMDIKPGEKFVVNGQEHLLKDTAIAQVSYKTGETHPNLACTAIYLDPERN